MKRNNSLFAVVSAVSLWGLLFLGGCSNLLTPSQQDTSTGKVTISVIGEDAAARTLYPDAQFSKYELIFKQGGEVKRIETLLNGKASVVITGLAAEVWDITAVGYVEILVEREGKKEFAAAEGTQTVDIATNSSISIPISATQEGPDGYLSWNISFPEEKVDSAYLQLTLMDGSWGGTDIYLNLISAPENRSGQTSLPPGYYLAQVRLENGYQEAGHTEVIHIYSNMETRADYTYTAGDFADFITLSGTATVKLNNVTPDFTQISLFANENRNGNPLGSSRINPDGTWSINLLPFASSTTLYAWVSANIYTIGGPSISQWKYVGPIDNIYNANKTIPLGNIDINTITLGGTANVTVTGATLQYLQVTAYSQSGNYSSWLGSGPVDSSGHWSINVSPLNASTEVRFDISVNALGGGYFERETEITRSVSTTSILDIDLGSIPLNLITLSGTANVTYNGFPPANAQLSLYANENRNGDQLGRGQINTSTRTWSILMEAQSSPTTLYPWVYVSSGGSSPGQEKYIGTPITGGNVTQDGFTLGNIDISSVTLSGTISGTVDGKSPDGATVLAFAADNTFIGEAGVQASGNWSMSVEAINTTVHFSVLIEQGYSQVLIPLDSSYNRTITVSSGASGINMNGLSFTTKSLTVTVPVIGMVIVTNSKILSSDISQEAPYSKIIAMAQGVNSFALRVPQDTSSVYFTVMTESNDVYMSSSAVNYAASITLNLSQMEKLSMPW
ncbi:putative lipoprotein [Treponema primitia ZAS-2]|uniref:Putative lipoprotein n=1 Tax=Treponema primitia (strain ATCC BAA-887 / DSM 12427 / ZAS-2) TaxID=545694 RepID=F5YQU7_TREPZ|nr:hypothetical protein [Treponema primitia]AEF84393.1 putative lipoprotein [Treponema primitia ZAS-2]